MSTLFLIDPFIRSLRPAERGRVEYWDDNVTGLSIRVSEAGRKTWSVVYRINGRLRRYTLGVYPVLGLADARRKAAAALHEVASGSDPAATKIEARRAETFAELAEEYVAEPREVQEAGRRGPACSLRIAAQEADLKKAAHSAREAVGRHEGARHHQARRP